MGTRQYMGATTPNKTVVEARSLPLLKTSTSTLTFPVVLVLTVPASSMTALVLIWTCIVPSGVVCVSETVLESTTT